MSGTVPPIAENFNTSDQLVATQQNGDGTTTDRLTTGAQVAQTVAAQLAIGGPLQSAAGVDLSLALVTPTGSQSAQTMAALAARQQAASTPATSLALGVVKIGAGLTVAGDGTVAANIGTTTGSLADGGVVAGYSGAIASASAAAASALTAANAAQPGVAAAPGKLMGGPATLGGALAAIVLGAGLALSGSSLAVAFGTGPNTALQGSMLGAASGVAPLDATGKVPLANISAALIGGNHYIGSWNASTNTPAITSGASPGGVNPVGSYYITTTAGTPTIDGVSVWNIGDWIIWDGAHWDKIDGQANPVSSVAGRQGAVSLANTDISGLGTISTQAANSVALTGGAINGVTIGAATPGAATFTTVAGNGGAMTVLPTGGSGALSLADFHANLISAGAAFLTSSLTANAASAALAVNMQALNDTQTNAFGTITNWMWGPGAAPQSAGLKNTGNGFGALNALGSVAVSPENTANGFACLNSFGSASGPGGYNGSNTGNGSKVFVNMAAGSFNTGNGQGCGSAIVGTGAQGAYHNALYGHGVVSGFDYGVVNPSNGILNVGFVAANPVGLAAFGDYALQCATTASYIFAGGYGAGEFVTTASYCAFTGPYAGQYINTGQDDVANGAYCMAHAGINVSQVTASGSHCLQNIQTNNHVVSGYKGANAATTAARLTASGGSVIINVIDSADVLAQGTNAGTNFCHASSILILGSNVCSNGVQGATGSISDGGGLNAGTILTITNIGTKNAGFAVGDRVFCTGVAGGTTITGTNATDGTLTGTGGIGTYRVNNSQLMAATTDIYNRDFPGVLVVGNAQEATQPNQIWIGGNSHTNLTIGGANGPKAGGLAYVDIPSKVTGLGSNVLANLGANGASITSIGGGSGLGLVASTGGTVVGANAQQTGDFNNICVFGPGSSANAAGQIVIGPNLTVSLLPGSSTNYYDITIGAAGKSMNIAANALTLSTGGVLACPAGFAGNTSGAAPASGIIGELQQSTIIASSPVTMTTVTPINLTSIALPVGTWSVYGNILYNPAGAFSVMQGWIGSTSTAAVPSGTGGGSYVKQAATFTASVVQAQMVGRLRVLITAAMVLAGTNIVYLSSQATFASTCNATGTLNAERVA